MLENEVDDSLDEICNAIEGGSYSPEALAQDLLNIGVSEPVINDLFECLGLPPIPT